MIELAFLLWLSDPAATTPPLEKCSYDPEILSLSFDEFDQDMNNGWRQVAQQLGCEMEAARLIRIYRLNMEQRIPVLYFHEGQLKASAGDYPGAVSALRQSFEKQDSFGWNAYVRATMAFL